MGAESPKSPLVTTILPGAIIAAFLGVCVAMFPFIFQEYWRIALFVGCGAFFSFVVEPLSRKVSPHLFQHLSTEKRLEAENRLTSFVFNMSTGIPSYLAWYSLLPGTTYSDLVAGRTGLMDAFSIWSIAYIMYDFSTLYKVYGKGSILIQLHHIGEAVIVSAYTGFPVAAAYIVGGGLMQFSSGVLHIHRVCAMAGIQLPKVGQMILNWLLIISWGHSRMIAFPYLMITNIQTFPMSYLHAFLIFVGIVLTIMNGHWMWKIVRMKSLAF